MEALLADQLVEKPTAAASPRFCDPHRERAGVNVPAKHFILGQAFCDRCFNGAPIRFRELRDAGASPAPQPVDVPELPPLRRATQRGAPLSRREHQIVELVARGYQNKQIAMALRISERTAKYHISESMAKSGTRSRAELATWFTETDGAGLDASVLGSLRRVERDLERARAIVSESAGAALRQLRASSEAQRHLSDLESAFAALTEFARSCVESSDLDRRLQHPRGTTSHLASYEESQATRDFEGDVAGTGETRSARRQVRG